jgi:hypothetical protein
MNASKPRSKIQKWVVDIVWFAIIGWVLYNLGLKTGLY